MKKKTIFLDALSIQKKGIKCFLNSKDWPVSENLFWKLTNFIYQEYINELKTLDQKSYKIALIDMKFLGLLINILHYNYVKNFLIKNNYEYFFDKSASKFLNPNWEEISKAYEKFDYPYNKLMRLIRKSIKLIYFNRHLKVKNIIKGILYEKTNLSFGSFDKIKEDYIKNTYNFYLHIEWIDVIKKCNFNKKNLKNIKIKILDKVLKKISKNSSLNPFIQGLSLKVITSTANARLQSISLIYDYLLTLKTPKELIITESANSFHKIISSAYLSKGSKVVNFSHGNDIGLVHQKWTQTYFYGQSGSYAFENNKICNIFKNVSKNLPLNKIEKTNFLSVDSDIGLKRDNITYKKIRKNKIKKVMVMGYPMNSTRYTDDVYCFFHYAIKLQIQLLINLKNLGYYTIYKSHPDRLLEVGNLMNKFADECNNNKFENVWDTADALVFTITTSTTFGFAITTPLPIVLINATTTDWNYSRKLQIKKRIHVLDYTYNNGKHKGIDSEKLHFSLEKAKNKIPINLIKGL